MSETEFEIIRPFQVNFGRTAHSVDSRNFVCVDPEVA